MQTTITQVYILVILLLIRSTDGFSQEEMPNPPKGNFYGDLFLNMNHNIDANQMSFRLNRLHFGYQYNYNDHLYFNGLIESAREDYDPQGDYNGITNLFEFCLGFNYEKISGKLGLIGTALNQQQEKLWKNRYIDKVFADKYGFAPTNDFGGIVIFKPFDLLNIDVAVTNGEGHKNAQMDSSFRYALGVTFNIPGNFVARVYNDFIPTPDGTQINTIAMAGYQTEKLSVGLEWNKQTNKNFIEDYSFGGFSGYGSYSFIPKYTLFGRYDYLSMETPLPGNLTGTSEGSLFITGLQYQIHQKVVTALNYRLWEAIGSNNGTSYIFLDLALNF